MFYKSAPAGKKRDVVIGFSKYLNENVKYIDEYDTLKALRWAHVGLYIPSIIMGIVLAQASIGGGDIRHIIDIRLACILYLINLSYFGLSSRLLGFVYRVQRLTSSYDSAEKSVSRNKESQKHRRFSLLHGEYMAIKWIIESKVSCLRYVFSLFNKGLLLTLVTMVVWLIMSEANLIGEAVAGLFVDMGPVVFLFVVSTTLLINLPSLFFVSSAIDRKVVDHFKANTHLERETCLCNNN